MTDIEAYKIHEFPMSVDEQWLLCPSAYSG